MILVLVSSAEHPNQLIRALVQQFDAAGEQYLLSALPSLFLRFDSSGRTRILHENRGIIEPAAIFHWVVGLDDYSILEALDLAGYRLINPLQAWRIGRNKCMQLAVFEREEIPHPWTLFSQGRSWAGIEHHLQWDGREHVLKPHDGGRGRSVHKTRNPQAAAALYSRTPRFRRQGILIQEYLDHSPKVRHHFRVNVIGGEAVTGTELRASGESGSLTGPREDNLWPPPTPLRTCLSKSNN